MRTILSLALFASAAAFAQAPAGLSQVFDNQVGQIEREVLGLAQKMPADRYDFAPKTGTPPNGTFDGVRTFAQQVRHIATVMYMISSEILGEKNPVDMGSNENGSDNLKSKDQIVKYFQDSIAYAHKAMRSINAQTSQDKLGNAAFMGLHSYDHYGQMVVYARLNGVTPGGPPPAPAQKGKGKGK